jgi:hypothetical protein
LRIDTYNHNFIKHKEEQMFKHTNFHAKNLDLIHTLSLSKSKKKDNFCHKDENNLGYTYKSHIQYNIDEEEAKLPIIDGNEQIYLYSQQRKNYYADYYDQLRKQYIKDKSIYPTYSLDHLSLSFPMIKNSNVKYDEYMENKGKWKDVKDFDRYKQVKEFAYIPKKQNEL